MSEETGIPTPEPVDDAPEQPTTGDYHTRIQSEPEFAVGEVKKKDSYIGKLQTELKKFEALKPLIDAGVPASQIVELANDGYNFRNAPQQQAQPVAQQTEEEDEIYDPEIKAVSAKFQRVVEEQAAVIKKLQDRLNVTETRAVRGTLEENIGSALKVFSDFPDQLEEAKGMIMSAVEVSEKRAQAGDEQAQRNLDALAGPQGIQTLRMMVQPVYDKVFESLRNRDVADADGTPTKQHATDTPSSTRSAPPTPELAVGTGRKVNAQLFKEMLEKATEAAGKSPDLWNH